MDREKLLLELNYKVKSIIEHINRLKDNELDIHKLDVDMLKKKTVEFYDTVFELEKHVDNRSESYRNIDPDVDQVAVETYDTEPPVIKESPATTEVVSDEIIIKEDVIIEDSTNVITNDVVEDDVIIEEVDIPEPTVSPPPIIEHIPKPEVIPEPIVPTTLVDEIVQEPIVVDVADTEQKPSVAPPKQATYDLFSGNAENAVAEKYHDKEEQSIADKMQKSHILNIREAIGINEKFLFINELFNGDLGRYNKILDDINDLTTKQGVDTYLFELKIQFQWSDDSEAYFKLKELLERKFI